MKMRTLAICGVIACLAALLLHAQTIGGDTALSSKTWTFVGTGGNNISQTTLFTPTVDSDFQVTIYISSDATDAGGGAGCPTLYWTDDYNSLQSNGVCSGFYGPGIPVAGQTTLPLHVKANSGVSISATLAQPSGFPTVNYTMVVSKTKLNP